MIHFDPNEAAPADSGIFGLPHTPEEANLVLIPVPWDLTTSYGAGAAEGPELIYEASHQVDLFDIEVGKAYEAGYAMLDIPLQLHDTNREYRDKMESFRENIAEKATVTAEAFIEDINDHCERMNDWVYESAKTWRSKGKIVGLIGGDHSSPLGLIHALSEEHNGDFGILHLDAHADLRNAYEDFTYSHASIMYNVMSAPFAPKKLVQVGIRDFCEEEFDYIQENKNRIQVYFDSDLKARELGGESWLKIASEIVTQLPEKVYISFDIDGLDPTLCPNTGTPVPGGLSYHQATTLFRLVYESGKKIIGFDLNEVSPGESDTEWDGNVGARLLFKLCGWTVCSQGLRKPITQRKLL